MFMARRGERLGAEGYTRASVEEYLRAVSEERARIGRAAGPQAIHARDGGAQIESVRVQALILVAVEGVEQLECRAEVDVADPRLRAALDRIRAEAEEA